MGDQGDRYVVRRIVAADRGVGLVVAEDDEYQIVVAVLLHVRHEGGQRVLDGTSVPVAHAVGVALDGFHGIIAPGFTPTRDAVQVGSISRVGAATPLSVTPPTRTTCPDASAAMPAF